MNSARKRILIIGAAVLLAAAVVGLAFSLYLARTVLAATSTTCSGSLI